MADPSKFLNYGDFIHLKSPDTPKSPESYLCARSVLEEKIFFLKSPKSPLPISNQEVESTFYENQSELLFAIYPKLNYQAYKNFNKLKPNEDLFRVELLKKRLNVEQELNQKILEKIMSTPVTFGSEVQLFHVSSKSFVRATREKNSIQNELYDLRLSKKGGSGMYFKVIPYLTFKKEGERISLKDQFYLENSKLDASIVYKSIPRFPPRSDHPNDQMKGDRSPQFLQQSLMSSTNELNRNYMPILELSSTFDKFEAGLRKQDLTCPFSVQLILSQKQTYSPKTLLWGDYVRLKFMLSTKQTGYFYCDHTIIGASPNVFCRIVNTSNQHEKESFQAVFQIVPLSDDLYGTPVTFENSNDLISSLTFENNKKVCLRLRHLLTGRYMQIGSENTKCSLSETVDEFVSNVIGFKDSSLSPNIVDFPGNQKGKRHRIKEERKKILEGLRGQITREKLTQKSNQSPGQSSSPSPDVTHTKQLKNQGSTFLRHALVQAQVQSQGQTQQAPMQIQAQIQSQEQTTKQAPEIDLFKKEIPFDFKKVESSPPLRTIEYTEENNRSLQTEGFENMKKEDEEEERERRERHTYFLKTAINLKNESHNDEKFLTSDSVFFLESLRLDPLQIPGTLTVKQNDKVNELNNKNFEWMRRAAYDDMNNKDKDKNYFESRFHNKDKNPLEKEEYEAFIVSNNDKYFHFSIVSNDEISEIMAAQSKIYPLIKLTKEIRANSGLDTYGFIDTQKMSKERDEEAIKRENDRKQKFVKEAHESVKKLTLWLYSDDQAYHTGKLSIQSKQKMIREVGIIDILMDLLIQIFERKFLSFEHKTTLELFKFFIQDIFALLQATIRKNKANNIYVFQWSNLLQKMTLDKSIANDLGVDKLLSQIFYEDVIHINQMSKIPENLNFWDYDLKALNIAIALYRYNPIRESDERNRIILTLIGNEVNLHKIFKKFELTKDATIEVYDVKNPKAIEERSGISPREFDRILKPGGVQLPGLEIDQSLEYKDKRQFDFCVGIIKLATEITRSKPKVVHNRLQTLIPLRLCTKVFQDNDKDRREKDKDQKWNFAFRSAFLDLFTEMYFCVESAELADLTFPVNIKFLYKTKVSSEIHRRFKMRKAAVLDSFEDQDFHIKNFIADFVNHPHKWSESEHKYVNSVFKLINLMCAKGLYNYEELSKLKQALYNYLKFGLAIIQPEITPDVKALTVRLVTTTNFDHKGSHISLKSSKSHEKKTKKIKKRERVTTLEEEIESDIDDEDDVEGVYGDGERYWQTAQVNDMTFWMLEALKIISFIEKIELDNSLKEFFETEESAKFFNEKLTSSSSDSNLAFLDSEAISQIHEDKEKYVLKYTNDNFVLQNFKNTLLLIELLLTNSFYLTGQIVHLLYLNFSKNRDFLNALNSVEVVHSGNVSIYNSYIKIFDSLRLSKIEVDSLHIENHMENPYAELYQQVDETLLELLIDLYPDNFGKSGDQKHTPQANHIYQSYAVTGKNRVEKQNLLRNIGFFEVITYLFNHLVKKNDFKEQKLREKNIVHFLHFYIFLCTNNPKSQELLASNKEFLKNLLSIKFNELQLLVLRLVSEIYKENFSLLIQIPQENNNIITLLLNKFFKYEGFPTNQFFIHCLRILPTFFQIKGSFFTQNQNAFAKIFSSKIMENPRNFNINEFFTVKLMRFLKNNKVESCVLKSDPRTVKVPLEISFAIYFLQTFSMMVAGTTVSNSVACLNNKYYLSIKNIEELIEVAEDWYNLKLALVTFLNHVYIRNKKLEDSEITELYGIVRGLMFKEITDYNRFVRNRHLYPRSPHQRFMDSFSIDFPMPTDFIYKDVIDEVYHQYILYGVLDTFLFYSQRLKSQPSDEDHAILDDYVSSSLVEVNDWYSGLEHKKSIQFDFDNQGMKNKMIMPLDEPPEDASIFNPELLIPQLKERKKAAELKKKLLNTTNTIRNKEQSKELQIYNIDLSSKNESPSLNEQLAISVSTIEARHNMELEILIKFLLDIKLEHPSKFKIVIASFMGVLGDEDTSSDIKQAALSIIKKLSNFKDDPEIYESIQIDLLQLKFIDFFDDVIVNSKNEDERQEFMLAMIDFLDDASEKVQQDLYDSLSADEENLYLHTIKRVMNKNFEDFRENEKNFCVDNNSVEYNAKAVIYKKMYKVIYALELLRLSCEKHFRPMQDYIREQVQGTVRIKKSINFINEISEMFTRYTKTVNERNAILGLKILDTLIEMLEGPCQENQIALCNARILENLEDLIVEINEIRKKKDSIIWTEMNNKIVYLILAIIEGSYNNTYIVSQVSTHINSSFMLERMEDIYNNVYRQRKKISKATKNIVNKRNMTIQLSAFETNLLDQGLYKQRRDDYKAFINEGIQLGIIVNCLSDLSKDIHTKLQEFKKKLELISPDRFKELPRVEAFYSRFIGQIEIVNKKGDLQRIYFPIVDKTKYLSSVTKDKFSEDVDRGSANEKLFGLLRWQQLFEDEMKHFMRLRKRGLKLSLTYFSRLRDINLVTAFATNIIILFQSKIQLTMASDPEVGHDRCEKLIRSLGVVHIVLCSLVLLFWGIFQAPLDIRASFRKSKFEDERNLAYVDKSKHKHRNSLKDTFKRMNKAISRFKDMLFDTYLTYLVASLLFAILGTSFSKIFFSFLLLDLIDRSHILNNVVKSVTVNYKQLLMTVVLGVLIMYIYAVLGFFVVLDGTDAANFCNSVWQCFLFMTNDGLRAGGGVGDVLSQDTNLDDPNYVKRYFYDLFYFLIIIIVLLNIIFGIIIDTFAELRDEKTLKGKFYSIHISLFLILI